MLSQTQHQGLGRTNMPDACVTVSKLVLVPADQGQARLRVPLSTVSTERRRTAHLRRGSGISSSISSQPRDAGLVVSGTCQRPIRIAPRCLGACCTKRFLLCFAVSGLWRLGPHTRPIRETLARKARHPHDPIHMTSMTPLPKRKNRLLLLQGPLQRSCRKGVRRSHGDSVD